VLLIIFMVSAPMLTRPLPLELPQPGRQNANTLKPPQLQLTIAEDGSYRLDGRPMSLAEIGASLEDTVAGDPRTVLQVANFKLHRSLKQAIKRFAADNDCEIRMDTAFPAVIAACANIRRGLNNGTWIVPAMQAAYIRLHAAGFAHSIETWVRGKLVGGLYFTRVGEAIFGESMFSHQTDASKIALAALVDWCKNHSIEWIDCQQQTAHLASLGAAPITRSAFIEKLKSHI
jgi:leucyl/phenylalanyl-tRNA--protein transferase